MPALTFALLVVGTATVTRWLFAIVDIIERPARRKSHEL